MLNLKKNQYIVYNANTNELWLKNMNKNKTAGNSILLAKDLKFSDLSDKVLESTAKYIEDTGDMSICKKSN